MRQQLESMMKSYQPTVSEQRQQTYFAVGDLESLSASALYTGKVNIEKFARTESIQRYNNGTIKTYVNPITNKVLAREQKIGEAHKNQMKPIVIDKVIK